MAYGIDMAKLLMEADDNPYARNLVPMEIGEHVIEANFIEQGAGSPWLPPCKVTSLPDLLGRPSTDWWKPRPVSASVTRPIFVL